MRYGGVWLCCWDFELYLWMIVCAAHKCQVGSLAGAAHALNENVGVLRCAGCVQKSLVDKKVNVCLTFTRSVRKQTVSAVVMWCCLQHDNTTTS